MFDGNGRAYGTRAVQTMAMPVDANSPRFGPTINNIGEHHLGAFVERHLDTTNVLYADGHVKSVKLDVLVRTNADGIIPAFSLEDD